MLVFLYFNDEEKTMADNYMETLKNNGVAVVAEELDNTFVACPGCENAPTCPDYDPESWCMIENNEYLKVDVANTNQEDSAEEYIRNDGVVMVSFPEHPYADADGFIELKRLVLELKVNRDFLDYGTKPDSDNLMWDERKEFYMVHPRCSIHALDGNEENIKMENLDVVADRSDVEMMIPETNKPQ